MESSNTELNRSASAPVKHDQQYEETIAALANLKTFSSEKKHSPPSSLSTIKSSSADDSKKDDDEDKYSTSSSSSTAAYSPNLHKSEETPVSENPDDPPTEAPLSQDTERSPSAYRIPTSVFERSPSSSSPLQWSAASNESLFSIHSGDMSFTNEQYSYMWRCGELPAVAEASTSDHMFSYLAPGSASGINAADMRSRELGLAEATMLEVIKESETKNQAKPLADVRINAAFHSERSNASNKSFAFSILGGETAGRMPSSVRSNQAQSQATVQPDPKTPRGTGTGNEALQSGWFSCFSCCSCRKKLVGERS